MAGLYIHIPFCKQACHYCNFHFSTSTSDFEPMLDAMIREMEIRKDYLVGEHLQSVYFGGGTPSRLSAMQIDKLFNSIHRHFIVEHDAEITFETNPDDLTTDKINELKNTPVNRLSIGVQSFYDEDLIWMNRAHSRQQAMTCIFKTLEAGFENLTIDLIYGIPSLSDENWRSNIVKAIETGITHISSYALTVESQTALAHRIRIGKTEPLSEDQSARQFNILRKQLSQNGFEHYEISNFAKNRKYAKHNTAYWKGQPYLGIGPSAHSFNIHSRSWNISNNPIYIKSMIEGKPSIETEILTPENRFNEYLMTGLRTMWGCNLKEIKNEFGKINLDNLIPKIMHLKSEGMIEITGEIFLLTEKGKLFADGIAGGLFI